MSINLRKKTGINLKKGSSINLEKKGTPLTSICFGLNWGMKERRGIGKIFGKVAVDLDGSMTMFAGNKAIDTVYYKKLVSKDGSIRHSGDDTEGDSNGDDGYDNEIIRVHLPKVSSRVDSIWIYLNSYKQQNFAEIPYSKIKVYEGTAKNIKDVLATFDLSSKPEFSKAVAMLMGKLVRKSNGWEFVAIGEPLAAKSISAIIESIKSDFLDA